MTTDVSDLWRDFIATKNPAIRERLILMHVPLVRYAAGQMLPTLHSSVVREDLVSYGMLGLLDAVDRYDPGRGAQFSTFAMPRIKGSMGDEIRSQAWEPRRVRSRGRAIRSAIEDLSQSLDRTPTDLEVSSAVGITVSEYRRATLDIRTTYLDSLNRPVGSAELGGVFELGDNLAAPTGVVAEHLEDVRERMAVAIAQMPATHRMILMWVYVHGMSFKGVAEALGVTDSWASALHTKALVNLQRTMSSQY